MLKKFNQKVTEGFLFTDQYQLSMAQLFYKNGLHDITAQFDHFFRKYPDYGSHKAGYCIYAGLEWLVDWIQNTRITKQDVSFLKKHKNAKGKNLFHDDFLNWLLKNGNFNSVTIKAISEGRAVHPYEPLTVVMAPLAIAQILETPLLNQLNYQTLIATKAARLKEISRGNIIIEFGARRAQDRGAIAGVRGALIGGVDFTSNVGVSHILKKSPKGTHAHSMVQLFLSLGYSELDAFEAFADLYPDDCILLVDTIDTLKSGIPNAIKVFEKLIKKGHRPIGIRLDSGDLAFLSIKAAKMLKDAKLDDIKIVLSNELDELSIWQIIAQILIEAPKEGLDPNNIINRLIWGVGTNLITSLGCPALGGVYKLVSIQHKSIWSGTLKISDNLEKSTLPGNKQIFRLYDNSGKATADLICLANEKINSFNNFILHHPLEENIVRRIEKDEISKSEPLINIILKEGKVVYDFPDLNHLREVRNKDLEHLHDGVKRLINPHKYHVSASEKLIIYRQKLTERIRRKY
jgi:nicotinate phosphoribosyltransferase